MDNKINFQQLARKVAEKKHISQKKAEAFLREFFDAIIRDVTTAGSVKITGLGTFKLIEVLDRESVNVNTGERIVIPGHSKLSFTPETSLKDAVNKPFADFQTVVLNESTSLEEMEKVPTLSPETLAGQEMEEPESAPEPISEPEPEPDVEPEPVVEPESEPEPVHDALYEAAQEPAPEPVVEIVSEPEPEPEPKPVYEPVAEPDTLAGQGGPSKVRALTGAEKCALTFGFILFGVLCYFLGYYRVLQPESESAQPEETPLFWDETIAGEDTTTWEDTTTVAPVVEVEQMKDTTSVKPSHLDPNKKYQIVGTRRTHIMKPGDYLTKIAVKEYGDKDFARYIISHNHFPDPDNVPVGKEIKLPELKEVKE